MNRWSLVFGMLFGSLLLLLAACGGGGPSSITVSGRVIDVLGQGVGGIKVRIGSTTVTTAPSGSFSISGVTTPYDAVVFDTSVKVAHYYKGLTRSDPTLTALSVTPTSPHSATLSGNLSGLAGTAVNPTDILVFFDSPGPETLGGRLTITGNNTGNNSYTFMSTQWLTSTFSTTGKVYTLEWTVGGGGLPNTYKGFGSKDVPTLTNGSFFNNQDVTLTSLNPVTDTHTLGLSGGGVGFPTTYTFSRRVNVKLRIGSGSGTLLFTDTSPPTPSYKLPAISGATVSLAAGAADVNGNQSFAWKAGLATNATGVSLSLPTAPSLTPTSGTSNVKYSTDFAADFTGTNFSNGVNVFYFDGPAGSPDFYVITKANTTKIPNLSGIGLGLPANTNYSWQVVGVAPFTSVDAAAGPGGFLRDFVRATSINPAPNADGSAVRSQTLTFTTDPNP